MEIIVIGGIAAGASIASKAKRTNKDVNVTIIEKEDYLSFGACGLPYYVGEQFTDGNMMMVRSIEKTENAGINVLSMHEVLDIDFDNKMLTIKKLSTGDTFTKKYDKLAIATGANVNLPGYEGINSENVYSITRLREVDKFKDELKKYNDIVIIGAGFIGVEIAEQLRHLGKNVSIIQRSDRIMSKVYDKEFSDKMIEILDGLGVNVLRNQEIEKLNIENNRIISIKTTDHEVKSDLVISAIGFTPNTSFIKDERLKMLKNGAIIIDEYGRTSIEDVWAAGDCATVYHRQLENFHAPLATYANKMGRIVGENMVSQKLKKYIGALGSSAIKVGDYGFATTGLSEDKAKELGINYGTTTVSAYNHSGYLPGKSKIMIKLVYNKEDRKLLGGQLVGKDGAVERLNSLTVAIYSGITVDELGFMDFSYAPPYSSTWDALNIAGNSAK